MPALPTTTVDPVTRTLAWIATRGLEVRSLPADPIHEGTGAPHPILYLLDEGVAPPPCGDLEDWIRHPVDEDELLIRADRLVERARRLGAEYTRIDDDDVLRVGDELVPLSRTEGRAMRLLIDRLGELVGREELVAAIWPEGSPSDPRALDNRMKSLRRRVHHLPVEIYTVRSRGLILERSSR